MSSFDTVDDVGGVPAVLVRPSKDRKGRSESQPKRQPPYAVVVHNDDEHTFRYVIELLQRVCAHPRERAYALTYEVHFHGSARVWTGSLELAELKRDQIRGYGPDNFAPRPVTFPLGVTLEPLPVD
jgi:ATP-dependent Clp protease adaptor protein ClpS